MDKNLPTQSKTEFSLPNKVGCKQLKKKPDYKDVLEDACQWKRPGEATS